MLPTSHLICLITVLATFSVSSAFNNRPRINNPRRALSNLGITTRQTRTHLQYHLSVKPQTSPMASQTIASSKSRSNGQRSISLPLSLIEDEGSKKKSPWRNTRLLAARRYSIPRRSNIVPRYQQSNVPIVTYLLIGINVLVFALSTINSDYKYRLMKINSLIARGQLYRLGTALFLHASLGHIFNNMSSLWQLGPMVSVFFTHLLCHISFM